MYVLLVRLWLDLLFLRTQHNVPEHTALTTRPSRLYRFILIKVPLIYVNVYLRGRRQKIVMLEPHYLVA